MSFLLAKALLDLVEQPIASGPSNVVQPALTRRSVPPYAARSEVVRQSETAASEDVYTFTTAALGDLQTDLSSCQSFLNHTVYYKLVNATSNATLSEGWSCWSQTINDLPAGDYRLTIINSGRTGTYHLDISQP